MPLPVIRSIRAYTLDPDYIIVEWAIEPTTLDLTQYAVEVWRGEAEGGPYTRVSMTMVASDVYDIQDRGVNLRSKWRKFFYRVRLISRADANVYQDYGSTPWKRVLAGELPGGVTMEAPPDIYALEAIRRFNLVLSGYGGRRVLVSVQKTWGQRCPNCWDALKRRCKSSKCVTCFSTGLVGGYFSPMEAWALKPPHREAVQLTSLFEMQIDDRIMWLGRYPRVKPRDVITSIDGDRFRVIAVSRSEKAWALTRQTVQVRRLDRGQVEYKIPISSKDWAINSLTAGVMREHIRATDIDSYYAAGGTQAQASVDPRASAKSDIPT